jgi:hypothetical protein
MTNAVFWDVETQVIPHRKHKYVFVTEPNQLMLCKIGVFAAVTMKNAVFWDVVLCGSCKNRLLEECLTTIFRVEGISDLGTLAVTSKLLYKINKSKL